MCAAERFSPCRGHHRAALSGLGCQCTTRAWTRDEDQPGDGQGRISSMLPHRNGRGPVCAWERSIDLLDAHDSEGRGGQAGVKRPRNCEASGLREQCVEQEPRSTGCARLRRRGGQPRSGRERPRNCMALGRRRTPALAPSSAAWCASPGRAPSLAGSPRVD